MFFRLLLESFRRQRRRKLLAGAAILLGTTAVTAMLALATTVGDRIHQELAVYGANLIVTPQADALAVKIGGVDLKPDTGNAFLHESDLEKLRTIFWANNITGVSPELRTEVQAVKGLHGAPVRVPVAGYWYDHSFGGIKAGAPTSHPWWKLVGRWPQFHKPEDGPSDAYDAVVGQRLADRLALRIGDPLNFAPNATRPFPAPPTYSSDVPHPTMEVTGIVSTGGPEDDQVFLSLPDVEFIRFGVPALGQPLPDAISRVEISARTRPEDSFARKDPDTLSPKQRDLWYCRPYANSIAYQIREAIPGADATQLRQVEASEGNILSRISGLLWLVAAAALISAGFAVSAAMATAILERRVEIGLMRSLGASRGSIALLFYVESAILACIAGLGGYLAGSALAAWLGARIFSSGSAAAAAPALTGLLNPVLLPVVLALALTVALAGSTPSIRSALLTDPSNVLRSDA